MRYFLIALSTLFTMQAFTQNLWVDIYGGSMNYQGEIQTKTYEFSQAHFAGGAGFTYDLNDHFSTRLQLTFGKISAYDFWGINKERNLNFSSSIFETQLALRYNIFSLDERDFTPFVFAGVALFHFNPYTFDTTGTKYFLKPLSTEGEGFINGVKPYNLTQVSIPFGGGIRYALSQDLHIGLELGLRKTFTDYLDDVSTRYPDQQLLLQERGSKAVELSYRGNELKDGAPYPPANTIRGNSRSKDWYYFTAISLSIRLGRSGDVFAGRSAKMKQWECPKW